MKIFDKGLYKEGMRQTRFIGIVFTIVMMIPAVMLPLGKILSNEPDVRSVMAGVMINPMYVLSFLMYIPLMALVLFSFLDKRYKSDYYHSLPHKRETVYISFTASILTWVLISLLLTAAVTVIFATIGYKAVYINYYSMFVYVFNCFAGSVFVLGATLIAMSLTGTVFSNVVTAILIIVLPRTIISSFIGAVNQLTPIATSTGFGIMGDVAYNIPLGTMVSVFNGGTQRVFGNPLVGVYALIMGLIMLFVGGVFFKRRRSEAAGTSAVSRTVQAIIRISISFLFCLIACSAILSSYYQNSGNDSNTGITIFVAYVVAILVYFTYEIISTKKIANVKKILPGLLILVMLNLAFLGGAMLVRTTMISKDWDANEIEYINMYDIRLSGGGSLPYEVHKLSEYEISNDETKKVVADLMTSLQNDIKDRKNLYANFGMDQRVSIVLKNGKVYERRLILDTTQSRIFTNAIEKSGAYEDVYGSVPENPENVYVQGITLDKEKTDKIYETLKEEVKTIDKNLWREQTQSLDMQGYSEGIIITVMGSYGTENYTSNYSINKELTPKTLQVLLDIANEERIDQSKALLNRYESGKISVRGDAEMKLYVSVVPIENTGFGSDPVPNLYYSPDSYGESEELLDELESLMDDIIKLSKEQLDKPIDISKPIALINLAEIDDKNSWWNGDDEFAMYMNYNDELAKKTERVNQLVNEAREKIMITYSDGNGSTEMALS